MTYQAQFVSTQITASFVATLGSHLHHKKIIDKLKINSAGNWHKFDDNEKIILKKLKKRVTGLRRRQRLLLILLKVLDFHKKNESFRLLLITIYYVLKQQVWLLVLLFWVISFIKFLMSRLFIHPSK